MRGAFNLEENNHLVEIWKLNSYMYFHLRLQRYSCLISVKWMILEVLLQVTK